MEPEAYPPAHAEDVTHRLEKNGSKLLVSWEAGGVDGSLQEGYFRAKPAHLVPAVIEDDRPIPAFLPSTSFPLAAPTCFLSGTFESDSR